VTPAAEMATVSGRTVHRGPPVRPGAGDPEQVRLSSLVSYKLNDTALRGAPSQCHLPYGITQCYLPPDTSEHALP